MQMVAALHKRAAYPRQRQTGVALITAILLSALAAIAASAMLSKQQRDIRRTENILHFDQAYLYALATEEFVIQALGNDDTPNKDLKGDELEALGQLGFAVGQMLPFNNGSVSVQKLQQLSGLFPINNLIDKPGKAQQETVNAFKTLLEQIDALNASNANAPNASALNTNIPPFPLNTNFIVQDWLDIDDVTTQTGAEDMEYASLERPYLTAGSPFADVTELASLVTNFGLNKAGYRVLVYGTQPNPNPLQGLPVTSPVPASSAGGTTMQPANIEWINAVPPGAKINVNIASAEVLYSLMYAVFDEFTMAHVQALIDYRNTPMDNPKGFDNIDEFEQEMLRALTGDQNTAYINKKSADRFNKMNFDVKTEYMEVHSYAIVGNSEVTLRSLLFRDSANNNKITVIRRDFGGV